MKQLSIKILYLYFKFLKIFMNLEFILHDQPPMILEYTKEMSFFDLLNKLDQIFGVNSSHHSFVYQNELLSPVQSIEHFNFFTDNKIYILPGKVPYTTSIENIILLSSN